jgi:hypothetical protein
MHPAFTNNTDTFEAHFTKIDQRVFKEQFDCLKRLGDFCRSQGISLVLANSPMAPEVRPFINLESYKLYLAQVSSVASEYGATFIDLNRPELFNHDDFADAIHLNGRGGEKYFDQIAVALSRQSKLAAADGRHWQIQR